MAEPSYRLCDEDAEVGAFPLGDPVCWGKSLGVCSCTEWSCSPQVLLHWFWRLSLVPGIRLG